MKAKWNRRKGMNPRPILEELRSISIVHDDGKVSFNSLRYYELTASLSLFIRFKSMIVNPIRERSISYALREMVKNNSSDPNSFIQNVNWKLSQLLSTQKQPYTLLTSLSCSGARIVGRLEIQNATLHFITGEYPKKYAQRTVQERNFHQNVATTPGNYQKVLAFTSARHPHEAARIALDALDAFRALCCLQLNLQMQFFFGPSQVPINKILLGGMHTLHEKSGKLANSHEYWYEPYFTAPKAIALSPREATKVGIQIRKIVARLSKCSYSTIIFDALLRYVRALDETDPSFAALRLWSALEAISCVTPGNSDPIVRRCSFVVGNSEFHEQNLEALREYRNANVHFGIRTEEARTYCYQMQFYFRKLFLFHYNFCTKFKSLSEVNKFLDLPKNVSELRERAKMLDDAIKYRNG